MMGVPPSNVPPGSTPSSSGRSSDSEKGRLRKPFHLPERGERDGQQDKKSLFDLAREKKEKESAEGVQQQLKQDSLTEQKINVQEVQEIASVEGKQAIAKVAELIQKMVNQLQVGVIGGKDFASVELKDKEDVPSFFANTTLNLTQSAEGLHIHFTNFETPQQQAIAVQMIEKNKAQLTQLMLTMQSKNIAIAGLQIGDQSITLPRIEPLPPPFKPVSPTVQIATEREKREQQREEKGEDPERTR